jgi:hypothetical protein
VAGGSCYSAILLRVVENPQDITLAYVGVTNEAVSIQLIYFI